MLDVTKQAYKAGSLTESHWIDISVPIKNSMIRWPDDPPVELKRLLDVAQGDTHTLTGIKIGSHTGTHIDAPLHFFKSGESIDRMPLDIMIGRARIIEIKDAESVKVEELVRHRIRPGERILLKTANSARLWQTDVFREDYIYITDDAARFLVQRKVRLIGIDGLSVGSFHEGGEVHRTFLENDVWIVEGLDLSRVKGGRYELICLPLKLFEADGAPARAIARLRLQI